MVSYYTVILLCAIACLGKAGRRPRFEPLPICPDCVPIEDILAPGIGIDLTTSYATAAIRYHNGSVVSLGKVEAPAEYIELMIRLSNYSSKGECTNTAWDEIRCFFEQAKRRLNKARGIPATVDVGIIAEQIIKIRAVIENQLGPIIKPNRVLAAVPRLPGLIWEDVSDALEFAGLQGLRNIKDMSDLVSELSATFAGLGYGLCEHCGDTNTCEDEDADMPFSHILALNFNHVSLHASYTYTQSAYCSTNEKQAIDFGLGFDRLPHDVGERKIYWGKIRDVIVEVGRGARYPLTHVLLLGDAVDNPDYLQTVRDALRELALRSGAGLSVANESFDPVYLAARGAAKFAKRILGSPGSCAEPPYCRGNQSLLGAVDQVLDGEL